VNLGRYVSDLLAWNPARIALEVEPVTWALAGPDRLDRVVVPSAKQPPAAP
jgi:hypothetical protein